MKRTSLLTIIASIVLLGSITETGSLMLGGRDAHAIIGRPATPVSYAGVARRTARRTPYGYGAPVAGAAVAGAAAGAAVGAAAAARVYSLPAGCVFAGGIYTCGAVRYQPVYSGTTVVYQVI